ncbi:MAG: hypothetical protein ACM31I_05250 [Deltaproteobacteria bacterium]
MRGIPRERVGSGAIAGDAQRNVDFYAGVPGLRLLKLTVDRDDPTVYHIPYGGAEGRRGNLLTSFPWPGAGSPGSGRTSGSRHRSRPCRNASGAGFRRRAFQHVA